MGENGKVRMAVINSNYLLSTRSSPEQMWIFFKRFESACI